MVTPTPEFAVEITGADYGVVGEGEIILHQLVSALREGTDTAKVKGLVINNGDGIVNTGPGDIITDLSTLPAIPYDLFPTEEWLHIGKWYAQNVKGNYYRYDDRVISVLGGRGCPFTCNFCYHHSRARYRSMDLIMEEADAALQRFDANMVYFSDETALPSPQRVESMLEGITKLSRKVEYSVSSRFDILARIPDELLREMRATGCRIMGLGIESGSDRILNVIGKRINVAMVMDGLDRLRRAGILPSVGMMVGQLSETVEDVEESIKVVRESVRNNPNIAYADFSICTPFPGSALYKHIFNEGYLKTDREFYDLYFAVRGRLWNYVVNLSAMSDETLLAMRDKIKNVYLEEKARTMNPVVSAIERSIPKLSLWNGRCDRKIFSKMRSNAVLSKSGVMSVVDSVQQWSFRQTHKALDKIRFGLMNSGL